MADSPETAEYRLCKSAGLWAAFVPSSAGLTPAWQLQITARGRGGKVLASLLETTPLRPLATVTLKGEAYTLAIGWHELRRGGTLRFGGARKLGTQGAELTWEMVWKPLLDQEGAYQIEMRVKATPRREGSLEVFLHVPLYSPELWDVPPARRRGHAAQSVWTAYHAQSASLVSDDTHGEDGWDETQSGFRLRRDRFPLGGGKALRFSLRFGAAKTGRAARVLIVSQYAAALPATLHPVSALACLRPSEAAAALLHADAHEVKGAERVYLKMDYPCPGVKTPTPSPSPINGRGESEGRSESPAPLSRAAGEGLGVGVPFFPAAHPFYPADALLALADWGRLHAHDDLNRLVRYGARGIAADFQVMGRAGEPEPNKGAFWDRMDSEGHWSDSEGGQTHGIASNARLARAFFLLHGQTGEALFYQSALNICHWLLLKQNAAGYYDGARVRATRGLPDDGKVLPQPCALDGAAAMRPLVLAFRQTKNEVFLKAAWKIANVLIQERMEDFDPQPPAAVAEVILGLLALDAEAPNAVLREALKVWGVWLRALPLSAESADLNADGRHEGLFHCAQAAFQSFALCRDPELLRYAFAALAAIPEASLALSWRALLTTNAALLALLCLRPEAKADFDRLQVTHDWRTFAPDAATEKFLHVSPAGCAGCLQYLPLVCRQTDQLLLIVLASPDVEAVRVDQNGRRPLARDLFTGALESEMPLHPLLGEGWARVGLWTIDP